MPSPARPKTKAQDLERIRQNQQRSRERKRVYIAELESKLAQLAGQVEQDQPVTTSSDGNATVLQTLEKLRRENDARRDLLLALGVAASAQDLFVRAFAMRMATGPTAGPSSLQSGSTSDRVEAQGTNPHIAVEPSFPVDVASTADRHVSISEWPSAALGSPTALSDESPSSQRHRTSDFPSSVSLIPEPCNDGENPAPLGTEEQLVNIALSDVARTASAFPDPLQYQSQLACGSAFECSVGPELPTARDFAQLFPTQRHPSENEILFGPTASLQSTTLGPNQPKNGFCVWNTVTYFNDFSSDNTTACSIAFSIVFQHNTRGLSTGELESRLQVGYRSAQMGSEDCRILNKVLFSVLAEIS